jgi:7-cyano-7-deazaguanine reductase
MIEAHDKALPALGYDAIDPRQLDTFAYEHPEQRIDLLIETSEFTAVCPFTGLPDFGTVRVRYVPRQSCIELRSFKYYLLSYRNVGIYYEHAVNHILNDLVRCCDPHEMTVELEYTPRGGMRTVASASYCRLADKRRPRRARASRR